MKKSTLKKALSLMLSFVFVIAIFPVAVKVDATQTPKDYAGCMVQHDSKWAEYSFNGGTLSATGCGIFSLVNCVGYLTGETMDVVETATWAHDVGGFNVYGADGTYRLELYPLVEAKYGSKYNITVDCDYDNGGYWEGASSSRLINHILNGGVAIGHVPGHFIAIVGYDANTKKFHIYDSSPSGKRGTNKNGGDVWVSQTDLSLNVFRLDWFCLLSSTKKDKEKPVISDVTYSDFSSLGYTVSCKITDNFYVGEVSFPTWTEANGQDDLAKNYMITQQGTRSGDRFSFRVDASKHNNEKEAYITHIYAKDRGGNVTCYELPPINLENDSEKPVISDVKVINRTKDGYTVSCKVTDNFGINSVVFPTWTVNNGQDDLAEGFMKTELGVKNGDVYTFEVKTSDHNNEIGDYVTHIYGIDCAGNQFKTEVGIVSVQDPTLKLLLKVPSDYNVKDELIRNVKALTSAKDFVAQFENKDIEVVDKDGKALNEADVVSSGAKINLSSSGKVLDSLTVVVSGDIDGNGKVDNLDSEMFKNSILEIVELNDIENAAADANGDSDLDCTDYINVKAFSLESK